MRHWATAGLDHGRDWTGWAWLPQGKTAHFSLASRCFSAAAAAAAGGMVRP